MTLGEAQRLFASRVPRLIDRIYDMGYECSIGDVFRDPRVHGKFGDKKGYGRSQSAHKLKLAIDINLFKDGVYLSDTESHRPFGEYWKGLDPENHRWGGDFDFDGDGQGDDGNHYSFAIWGIS